MMILDALRLAIHEHVVYFLLTAYVETLHYYDETRSVLPSQVTRLPLTGKADVIARLRALGQMVKEEERHRPDIRGVIEEATEIFAAASRRLSVLATQAAPPVHAPAAETLRGAWPAGLVTDVTTESGHGRESIRRNRYPGKRPRLLYGRGPMRSAAQRRQRSRCAERTPRS